jgi:hypothetical protein
MKKLPLPASGNNTKKLSTTNKMNGDWIPVQEEIGGTVLPQAVFQTQNCLENNNISVICRTHFFLITMLSYCFL